MRWGRGPRSSRAPYGVQVELVESPSGVTDDGDPAADELSVEARGAVVGSVLGSPVRARRDGRLLAIGLGVGLVVVVAAGVVVVRQEQMRAAALAELPWIVAPLREPLTEQWRVPGSWVAGEVAGHLLVTAADGSVVALDGTTGQVAWARPARAGGGTDVELCLLEATDVVAGSADPGPPGGAFDPVSSVLVCRWYGSGAGDGGALEGGRMAASVLDAGTGEEALSVAVAGSLLDTWVLGDGFVVTSTTADGHLRLERWELSTGRRIWSVESADVVVPAGGNPIDRRLVGDLLVVDGHQRTVAYSLVTGHEVDLPSATEAPYGRQSFVLLDGGAVIWNYREDLAGSGRVTEPDGTVRFELPGPALMPAVADGSVSHVLLVREPVLGGLIALDVASGAELWRAEAGRTWLVQVDGVLVTRAEATVRASSMVDGSTLWEAEIDGAVQMGGISDGEVVLVARLHGGLRHLAALDLVDGTEVWQMPFPAGATTVVAVGGHVIVYTGEEVLGLG